MTPRPPLMSIADLVALLAANIDRLCLDLLPNGKRSGHEWQVRSPAGEPGTEMAIHLTGPKAGVWAHFAGHARGDALDLVAHCLFGGNKTEALRWARAWLGLDGSAGAHIDRPAQPSPAERAAQQQANDEKTRRAALAIWLHGVINLTNTPVAWYLAGREIDLIRLARPPRAIRYHPALWHKDSRRTWPAMVTAISGPGGFMAVHRTYLEVSGQQARKAPVDQPKKVLGLFRGGHIAIARGASGKPLREATAGEWLDITEGIEDALTVAEWNPTFRVVAAVSLANLATIEIPPIIENLRIWEQFDKKVQPREAFDRAIAHHMDAGRNVWIPDTETGIKDINDMMRS